MTMTMKSGLKEGGGIEMSIYSAFHIRDARSPSLLNFVCLPCIMYNGRQIFHFVSNFFTYCHSTC